MFLSRDYCIDGLDERRPNSWILRLLCKTITIKFMNYHCKFVAPNLISVSDCQFRSGITVYSITATWRIVFDETSNSERDIYRKSASESENWTAGWLAENLKRQQKILKKSFTVSYQSRKRIMALAPPHLFRLHEMFWYLVQTKWMSRNNLVLWSAWGTYEGDTWSG